LTINCTENPFANNDNNKIEKEKLTGSVNLVDGATPDGIFVWLEEFNLTTFTDEKGTFSIPIPLPENQAGGTGFDGIFTIYFFMGNYNVDSIDIEFSQGEILEEQDNITSKGVFKNSIDLHPILNLRSILDELDDDFISINFDNDSISKNIFFDLQLYDETQVIFSMRQDLKWPEKGFFRTGMIFEPVNDDYSPIFVESPEALIYHDALLLNQSYTWTFELMLYKDDFEEIEYRAFPYLIIDHPGLPTKFWDALGRDKTNFDEHYFDYPFKRTAAKVQIIPRIKTPFCYQ